MYFIVDGILYKKKKTDKNEVSTGKHSHSCACPCSLPSMFCFFVRVRVYVQNALYNEYQFAQCSIILGMYLSQVLSPAAKGNPRLIVRLFKAYF